jgi:hypothetical protein
MRLPRALILATALLAGAAGCAQSRPVAVEPPPSSVGTGFQQRAAELASSWSGSRTQQTWEFGYVPLGDTTHLAPDAFHSGADKAAYLAGQFRVTVPLPAGPAQQTVRFDGGTTATRPGISATQALRTESLGHCPTTSCPSSLTVTGVRATTERVRTNRGMATIPAWAFRIQGYEGEFVFSAVTPQTLPNPVDERHLNGYQGASLVSVSADGRTLTLGTATGCGKLPPTGLVYETKDVVVVGATDKPAPMSPGTACIADLRLARVQVHLGDVLDGRTVINVGNGQPEAALG